MSRKEHARLPIVRETWPDLLAAIEDGIIPRVPASLGRDKENRVWECKDLHWYAIYALDAFLHSRGADHIDAEPEARSFFRMELVAAAVKKTLE